MTAIIIVAVCWIIDIMWTKVEKEFTPDENKNYFEFSREYKPRVSKPNTQLKAVQIKWQKRDEEYLKTLDNGGRYYDKNKSSET